MTKRLRRLAARILIPLFLLGLVPSRPAHAMFPFFVPLMITGYSSASTVSVASVASAVASALIGGTILALAVTPQTAEAPEGSAVRMPTTDTGASSDALTPPATSAVGEYPGVSCPYGVGDGGCYATFTDMCDAYRGRIVSVDGDVRCALGASDTDNVKREVHYTRVAGQENYPNLYVCGGGYVVVWQASKCVLVNSREIESDNKLDFQRSGTELTQHRDVDSGNEWLRPTRESVNGGTNNAAVMSGKSEAGEPRRVVIEAMSGGGSRLVIQDQKTDAAGNSYLQHKTVTMDQSGTVTNVSTHATAQSLNATTSTNAQTGAATTQYTVAANPASTYSPAVAGSGSATGTGTITFPTDYARQGEAQSAANSTNVRLDAFRSALMETSAPPSDPAMPQWSFFEGTFSGLLGWSLPGHASQCPAGSFYAFGESYVLDAHCSLVAQHWSGLEAAMSVVWVLVALFIVLGA